MNDLDMLKDLRASTPEITRAASAAARNRLMTEMTAPSAPARLDFLRGRMAARVVLAGAMGVALAGGIAVVQLSGDPDRSVLPGGAVADAAVLGDRAARAAEGAPYTEPRPHQWIYIKARNAGPKGDTNTWWLGVDPARTTTTERWLRVDGHRSVVGSQTWTSSDAADTHLLIKRLPTDPDALLRVLPGLKNSLPPVDAPAGQSFARMAFGGRGVLSVAAELFQRPLPPKLRAALFRALPRVPGVTLQRNVKDAAGRAGLAFATSPNGWSREMIILDPRTYRILGTYSYATRDKRFSGGDVTRKGTVLWLTAEQETRVVDKPGERR
ncbi:CU044_5270 family protein [Spirillospora sp. CA-294931]|uniref:CU044_5270 family protein n=1 Tax=Spirillospora sp. CA-294931 TaxID=3240042 RepID=UPI003D8E7122